MVGIFYSFEVKRLEKSKTEELFVPPQETATERSKLERQKLTAWIKILTPNKLLIKLPVLLALIKAENNLYKVKENKIRHILYLWYQHNKVSKTLHNN